MGADRHPRLPTRITAFWFNNRKEAGPAATPQSTRISDGLAQAA